MSEDIQHVAIIGCGIGGLTSALALNRAGIATSIYERDPAPPAGIAPADSMQWLRKGVPQSRHPHFFMGRLRKLIDEDYPDLARNLRAAGVGENALEDYIDPVWRHRLHSAPVDADLRSFNSRRTTFEMTTRTYVAGLDNVTVHEGARVSGITIERAADGLPAATGVRLDTASGPATVLADAVVDASGRSGRLGEELKRQGVRFEDDQRDSGLWYFTRHYRLRSGQTYPASTGLPGAQFHEFIVGALPADNGAFTITFQIFREDEHFIRAIRDPDHFQKVCASVKQIAPWVDANRSEPTSGVFGFGQMDSFWRRTVLDGKPQVLGLFCVGDSGLRTNPKYGRGCTWSAVAAHKAAELLSRPLSPPARIADYEAFLEDQFREDWETLRQMDRAAERAFQISTGRIPGGWSDRAVMRFQTLFVDALVTEPALFRDVWTGYHGLQSMRAWQRKPANWMRLTRALVQRIGRRRQPVTVRL